MSSFTVEVVAAPAATVAIPRWQKIVATFGCCWAYVALGMLIASLGAAFLHLQAQTDATAEALTFVFTCRSLGYLCGSAAGGVLLDRWPRSGTPTIALGMLAAGLCSALIPAASAVHVLYLLCCTQGFAMGTMDTIANVLLVYLWEDEAGPWMQGLHCSFAVGAVLSPLIVRASQALSADGSDISGGFYCFGAFTALSGVYFCFVPTPPPPPAREAARRQEAAKVASGGGSGGCCRWTRHARVILITGALLGVYVGAEAGFGGFVLLYAQEQYAMTEAQGQYLNAVFYGCLTAGRLIGVPLATAMTVTRQLALDLVFLLLACVVLAVGLGIGGGGGSSSGGDSTTTTGEGFLWTGAALFGLGCGTIFPCAVLQAEAITDLSGRAASVLMVGAAFGDMLIPLVVGLWTSNWAGGFVIALGLTAVVCTGLAVALVCQARRGQG